MASETIETTRCDGKSIRDLREEATPAVMAEAVGAVAALLGGPHCQAGGRSAEDWTLVAFAALLAGGAGLPLDLPLAVALRDRVAERLAGRLVTDAARGVHARVRARLVARRAPPVVAGVLVALCDGLVRTDQIAALGGLSCRTVREARRAIAALGREVDRELAGTAVGPAVGALPDAPAQRSAWLALDPERLARAVEAEIVMDGAGAEDGAGVPLSSIARRSARLHELVAPLDAATVEGASRAMLRRVLGPVVDALSDVELRAHAARVLVRPARERRG